VGAVAELLAGALAVARLEARHAAAGVEDALLAGCRRGGSGAGFGGDLAAGLGVCGS
jgi:hypothetical protein